MFKTPQEMAEFMKSFTPQVKTNKNGYEIRTKILEMAKDQCALEYGFKYQGWEMEQRKDGDQVVAKVSMPDIPGVEQILETAQKFYDFVENSNKKTN
jgi:hypothetical protein|tara:strand:+ start:250 stop:540 length:291 start_codon:yes stop_codon:yes gene_type:complete